VAKSKLAAGIQWLVSRYATAPESDDANASDESEMP
jgi:hypothetical protein